MSKYIIYAGREWKQNFVVLSDDGMTPEELDSGDTATISIYSSGPAGTCILNNIPMTLLDAPNGLFEVNLTADQTVELVGAEGFQEDGFLPIGTHTAVLEFSLAVGDIQADINIGVKGNGICQTA